MRDSGKGLVYAVHRTLEPIPSNISFRTQEDLERHILGLAYLSGKQVSVVEPG